MTAAAGSGWLPRMVRLPQLRRLLLDQGGLAVVELALAAPILALMVVGVADLSTAYSRKLALEQAAQRAIEKIMQTTGSTTPDATLKAEAVAQAGGGLVADDVTVSYKLFCNAVEAPDPEGNCAPGETEARYISVTVSDEYRPIFPIHFTGMNADGNYPVNATAGMRIQ